MRALIAPIVFALAALAVLAGLLVVIPRLDLPPAHLEGGR